MLWIFENFMSILVYNVASDRLTLQDSLVAVCIIREASDRLTLQDSLVAVCIIQVPVASD